MFHLSTLPSLREGGRWLVLIYVSKICSRDSCRYRFWTHLGTFKNICSPRYKGEKYVAFVLPETKAKK